VRNIWKDGKVERGSGNFGKWAAQVAESESVAFVDVTRIIADRYEKMGQEKANEFFPGDHTHTNAAGADFNAASVLAGLKALKGSPFAASVVSFRERTIGKRPPELFSLLERRHPALHDLDSALRPAPAFDLEFSYHDFFLYEMKNSSTWSKRDLSI
jgi:hypothetical protein